MLTRRSFMQLMGGTTAIAVTGTDLLARASAAAPDQSAFSAVLTKYFGGRTDEATLARL